ncbi:hypothetical protein [Streptomyces sp. NBC_00878]|uniref:hypothetical protein n=1 Tax=Streptomyces sp. NBC_00878 TaxID=2975854 RepID=UPI00225AE0A7|nr:hypothetical protein [Streptomyces sp. NBC_00878]MCX4910542.1 hypothetical protein [Streptomyces sp. NBC_00878]
MSFLKFAGDEVLEMAGTLETSGGQMKSASKEMKHADSKQIGHGGLESACDDFADSWDYGFGELSKLTKGVSKFAKKAADEFRKLDDKLYDELKKAGEGKK